MQLLVVSSGLKDIIPAGKKVSLSQNGTNLRIWDSKNFGMLAELQHYSVTFQMDDDKTSIEISGFYRVNDREYRPVHLECE